jgi:hypothetical protein
MYGSANATQLAATIQWNDIHTLTRAGQYTEFQRVFKQMHVNDPVRQGYLHYNRPHATPSTYTGSTPRAARAGPR